MDEELHLLTVVEVLHLLGYDHEEADEKAEMFGLQAAIVDGWRKGMTGPSAGPDRFMSPQLVIGAIALVVVAWLAACAEAGLARVSSFRAEEAVRSGRRGSAKLAQVAADPTRYLNVALLVRVAWRWPPPRSSRTCWRTRRDLGGPRRRHRGHGPRVVRRRGRLAARHRPPAPAERRSASLRSCCRWPGSWARSASPHPHRQRADARQGL